MSANEDIKARAHEAGVPLWRIARALSISENTFYRRLRDELPANEKQNINCIIDEFCKVGDIDAEN